MDVEDFGTQILEIFPKTKSRENFLSKSLNMIEDMKI
jgi:hypothetical protein